MLIIKKIVTSVELFLNIRILSLLQYKNLVFYFFFVYFRPQCRQIMNTVHRYMNF